MSAGWASLQMTPLANVTIKKVHSASTFHQSDGQQQQHQEQLEGEPAAGTQVSASRRPTSTSSPATVHQATFEMSLSAYNSRIRQWETVIEPWQGMIRSDSTTAGGEISTVPSLSLLRCEHV